MTQTTNFARLFHPVGVNDENVRAKPQGFAPGLMNVTPLGSGIKPRDEM